MYINDFRLEQKQKKTFVNFETMLKGSSVFLSRALKLSSACLREHLGGLVVAGKGSRVTFIRLFVQTFVTSAAD